MIRINIRKNATVLFAAFLVLLLAAKAAFSAEEPPALQTLAAQKHLAAVADRGQRLLVKSLLNLPSGERFARVEMEKKLYWLQLENEQRPAEGGVLLLEKPTYLFDAPVAEVTEEEAAPETAPAAPSPLGLQSRHPLNPKALGVNQACTQFITSGGGFGGWGAYMMGKINRKEHPSLFNGSQGDLPNVCPKFSRMSDNEKKNFWVWLVAAMANFESSCNERVQARGVNGTAAGLLQLHKGQEHVYGCRRGTNSLSARENLACGLTILNNDLRRTGRIFPSGGNYWEVLRPHTAAGARTLRVAKAYRPCF